MITNRGQKVYPSGHPNTYCTDHWRCRFVALENETIDYLALIQLMESSHQAGLGIIKTENLYEIDGQRAYSLGQGE
jgi:isocitrate dehydrogenase